MRLRRLFTYVLLVASGGIVFQTTTSCTSQLVETLATTLVSTAADALVQAIVGGLTGTPAV